MTENPKWPDGFRYELLPEADDTGREALHRGAGWIIQAERQVRNLDRLGNTVADNGKLLCFSVSVPLKCDPRQARSLQNEAGLQARNAIGGKAKIRWLNDVVIGEEQVCYVRCTAAEGVFVCSYIFDLSALESLSVSGECTDPCAIMYSVADGLWRSAEGYPENTEALLQAYCEHCLMIMKFVNVVYRGLPVYGFCFAIDRQGGMMVMTQESHTVLFIYSGPASLAKSEPEAPEMPIMPHI